MGVDAPVFVEQSELENITISAYPLIFTILKRLRVIVGVMDRIIYLLIVNYVYSSAQTDGYKQINAQTNNL